MATHQPIELTDGRASGEERYNGASPRGQDKELDVHRLRQTSGYLSDREASDFEAEVASLSAKINRRLSALGQRVAVRRRFVKDQLSPDRSVHYDSDRRLKLPKGHERKMHAERCFASQNVSNAADFQFDKSVKSNERVDKTGVDDSTGKRPTVRSSPAPLRFSGFCKF